MKILHLYYDLMNLYGENGTIRVLMRHLADQGLTPQLERKSLGDEIDFTEYAFVYCGSGTERSQKAALIHLRQYADNLKAAVESGIPMLFTGNSLEMLGSVIHGLDGNDHPGISLLPFSVTEDPNTRYTGDAVFEADWSEKKWVGFINKCSDLTGLEGKPLFHVLMGKGNHTGDEQEGFLFHELYATYLTGPVLVKNPHFMDMMVEKIGKRANEDFAFQKISYPYEEDSYEVTLHALMERIQPKS